MFFQKRNAVTLRQVYDVKTILKRLIRFSIPFIIIFTIEQIALVVFRQQTLSIKHCVFTFVTGGIGPGSFYYPILIQFIFVFPLIYIAIKKYDYKGLLGCIIVNCIYEITKSVLVMDEGLYRLLLFRYITVIAFGCYFAIGKKRINKVIWIGMCVIGIAFIILFKYFSLSTFVFNYWTGTSMIASFYIISIAKCLLRANKLHCKPIELLGKASYNVFLVQMAYYGICAQMVYSAVQNPVLQIVISMIICVSAGLGFYFLEDPLTKRVMKLIRLS